MGRILIDIGHGLYEGKTPADLRFDSGAITTVMHPTEFDLNLYTAVALQEHLQMLGHFAAFVPFGLELFARGRMAKDFDVFVSVHHNASEAHKAQGSEVAVHTVQALDADRTLAARISKSVAVALGISDRGIVPLKLAVLSGARNTNVRAAVLTEGFFMDHPEADSAAWPVMEGRAIAAAIHGFLSAADNPPA